MQLTRRNALRFLGLGATAFAAGDVILGPRPALADGATDRRLLFVYFGGGWDTLLGLDPRDEVVYGNETNPSGIHTAYSLVADAGVQAALQADPSGLVSPAADCNITFGPAIGNLKDHYRDLCVIRGVDMGTLTHEVGRRYFVTGKFPRGIRASGSDLGTWVAAGDVSRAVPNLVLGGMESYNEALDPRATGLSVNTHEDLRWVLAPVDPDAYTRPGMDGIQAALDAHHAGDPCLHRQLDPGGLVGGYRAALDKAAVVGSGALWEHFDFTTTPTPAIEALYQSLGIQYGSAGQLAHYLNGPEGRMAVAAQALTQDLSQVVSVQIEPALDTHFSDWANHHATRQRRAFDALAGLIAYLKAHAPAHWDKLTIVGFSEFARTPRLNANMGRDHHLANAALLAGAGIAGNQVIGATTADGYGVVPFDFAAQAPDEGASTPIRPADIHATVCAAMCLPFDHISNQEPQVLTAALRDPAQCA
jgi:hypothetical protein